MYFFQSRALALRIYVSYIRVFQFPLGRYMFPDFLKHKCSLKKMWKIHEYREENKNHP